MGVADWSFLTNHARVLLCIAHDPGVRLRDIAASLGITERSAHGIITDLTTAGYTVKLLNMIPEPRTIEVTLEGLDGGEMSVVGIDQPPSRSFSISVEPDRLKTLKVFVRQPADQRHRPGVHSGQPAIGSGPYEFGLPRRGQRRVRIAALGPYHRAPRVHRCAAGERPCGIHSG